MQLKHIITNYDYRRKSERFKISMPAPALVKLNEPAHLPVDAVVNFLVRPENIHDAFVVDKFFDNDKP